MPIVVPPQARADFALAKTYLCRDAGEREIFAKTERSKRVFRIVVNDRSDDSFDPQTNCIHWDPYSALRTARGGTQSPALGLGHELDHAIEQPSREDALRTCASKKYDNLEERRVICGSERRAARTLGESVRYDHGGTTYRVATPVSR